MFDPYRYLRPLLFSLPPEAAHSATLAGLKVAHRLGLLSLRSNPQSAIPVELLGLKFPNRLGLAAGLDKNATCVDALGALGVGFIEVGTVTPKPQTGNPRPRLFRVTAKRALINRMGFPNDGADAVCARLRKRSYRGVCGVSIGKNAATSLDGAIADYVTCLQAVFPYADYVAVNVSSPNTAQLRQLQHGDRLESLLTVLLESRAKLRREHGRNVPILIKLTADLEDRELVAAARASIACGIDGLIATNTTVQRDGLIQLDDEEGGLSGAPVFMRAMHAVQCIRAEVGANFPVIGVGGITTVDDAIAMRAAGADLLQIYTGLVYRGPQLINDILASVANV